MKKQFSFVAALSAILLLGFAARLPFLSLPLFGDNALWALLVQHTDKLGMNVLAIPHPPLAPWAYNTGTLVFQDLALSVRAIPLIFSVLIAFASALFARRVYGERTGLFTAFLVLFSSYGLVSSLITDSDPTLLSLFLVGLFWSAFEYANSGNSKWLVPSAVFSALLLFTKLQSVLLLVPVCAYVFFNSRKRDALAFSAALFSGAALSLIAFPLLVFLVEPWAWPAVSSIVYGHNSFAVLSQLSNPVAAASSKLSFLFPLAMNFGSLLLGLVLLSFFSIRRQDQPFLWWLFGTGLLYFLVLPGWIGADMVRFYSVLVPPAAILSARFLTENEKSFSKVLVVSSAAVFAALFAGINAAFPFPEQNWYNVSLTCIGSRISFPAIGFAVLFAAIPLAMCLSRVMKRRPLHPFAFQFFLSVSLGFGIFFAAAPLLQPDYSLAVAAMNSHIASSPPAGTLFVWNSAAAYYAGYDHSFYDWDSPEARSYASLAGFLESREYLDASVTPPGQLDARLARGGTVVLLEYPVKYVMQNPARETALTLILKRCRQEFGYDPSGDAKVAIFRC